MIVVDANLLIYAYSARSPHYEAASRWLETILSSGEDVGIPMQTILAFIRVLTNPRLPGSGLSLNTAVAAIDTLLQPGTVRVVYPGPHHWHIFRALCLEVSGAGNFSTDVHFAALAMEHNALLCSADTDFARFPGLRWHNPLASA